MNDELMSVWVYVGTWVSLPHSFWVTKSPLGLYEWPRWANWSKPEDWTDGQRGVKITRAVQSVGEESGRRREWRKKCGRWGWCGMYAHPLHPTAAQGSASARLIQSDQVWTPSPINPGMWRWWMWAIKPPALTCGEQHGEPWENVSAPG